jgi:hypothetical protein
MRTIQGVSYRGVAGYLRVVGRTQHSAERHAKETGTSLLNQLPDDKVRPGRYKGMKGRLHVYEIPVLLGPKVQAVLSQLVLRGAP